MARIVPSQVVEVIQNLFRGVESQQHFTVPKPMSNHLAAIVDLVDRVPDELVRLDPRDFTLLRLSVAAIRNQLEDWRVSDATFSELAAIANLGGHPVALIRAALEKCPDESPTPETAELEFIDDEPLRDSIRLDMSAADGALTQGDWKGATVLCGSAIEALLLWALQKQENRNAGALTTAVAALVSSQTLTRDPSPNPEAWGLHEYVEVAAHLNLIRDDTATLVRLAKGFRNLIHPGRAARLGQKCDRAMALGALAAVAAVARDLTPQDPRHCVEAGHPARGRGKPDAG